MKTASVRVVLLSLVFNACEDLQRFESAAKRYKSGESLSVSVVRTGSAFPEPAVVRLQNGDLLAIFQEPGGKKSRESAWMACRSTNFGEDWSKPVQVIAAAGTFQNPALFQMDDGLVVLTLGTAAPAARQDGKTGFIALIEKFISFNRFKIMLLGGPEDEEKIGRASCRERV